VGQFFEELIIKSENVELSKEKPSKVTVWDDDD